MDQQEYVEIDGSLFEGGGQILRNSVTFSCLMKKPVHVYKIRYNASKPGLKSQHLKGIQLVSEICNGKLIGDTLDSMEIKFSSSKLKGGNYLADAKTAGSACLLMQISIPCLLFADSPCNLIVKGGTNADMAPPIDFFMLVFQPIVSRFGARIECNLVRRGFYPKGGGEVHIKTYPAKDLKPIEIIDFGEITKIYGTSYTAGVLPYKVGVQMSETAKRLIYKRLKIDAKIDVVKENEQKATGTGSGIILIAETSTGCILAGSALGKRGKPAEQVGEEAAKELLESVTSKSCVDAHLQDQLILFMALCNGRSKIKTGPITLHTRRAIHVAEKLTNAQFNITKTDDELETNIVECQGMAFKA